MSVIWNKIVAFFTTIFVWIASLFGVSAPCGEQGYKVKAEAFDVMTEAYGLPDVTFGKEVGAFTSSGGTMVGRFEDTTGADFDAYLAALADAGFETYDARSIEENRFATLVTDETCVNVYRFANTGTLRVVAEPRGTLPPLTDDCENLCAPLLTGMKGETVVAAEGMGYIIRLADGSFIIIDGGMGDPDHVDSDKLMNILREQSLPGTGKPVVAAWIFSHLHGDHIGVFNCFSLDHHDDVVIEKLIFNFPCEEETAASDSPYMLDDTIYRYTQFKKNLADFYADVPVIKVHTGNRFAVRDAQFDVLYTLEDLYPASILDGGMNECSLLLKMTLDGQTFLWTGDFAFLATDLVLSEYGDTLSCDFLQMAHHGFNGTVPFYAAVDPAYALLPVWEGGYDEMMSRPQNQWLARSPNLKQMIVTAFGTWTISLPYAPSDGTPRLPDGSAYPAYPALLGQ